MIQGRTRTQRCRRPRSRGQPKPCCPITEHHPPRLLARRSPKQIQVFPSHHRLSPLLRRLPHPSLLPLLRLILDRSRSFRLVNLHTGQKIRKNYSSSSKKDQRTMRKERETSLQCPLLLLPPLSPRTRAFQQIYETAIRTTPGAPFPVHKIALTPINQSDLQIQGRAFSTAQEGHMAVPLPCPKEPSVSTILLKQLANSDVSRIPTPLTPIVRAKAQTRRLSPITKRNLSSISSTAPLRSVIPNQSSPPPSTTCLI